MNHVLALDAELAGFCGSFLRDSMSDERRQVIAAYLATKPPTDDKQLEVGQFLLRANHRDILASAFGSVPQGLRGALSRAGPIVHFERFYTLLHELLADYCCKEIPHCIAHLGGLDFEKLLIIRALPMGLRSPKLTQALASAKEATDVGQAFGLLIGSGVDENWLRSALRDAQDHRGLSKALLRAARRAHAPAHPVPPSEFYIPLERGEDLYRVARDFRNCLRSYLCAFLDERQGNAFALACRDGGRTVVHLTRENGKWKLEGLFKPRNLRPSRQTRAWIEEYLIAHGVVVDVRQMKKATPWDALSNLIETDLLGLNFEYELD